MNILDLIPSEWDRPTPKPAPIVRHYSDEELHPLNVPLSVNAKRHVFIETQRDREPERRCTCGRRLPCHRRICRRP